MVQIGSRAGAYGRLIDRDVASPALRSCDRARALGSGSAGLALNHGPDASFVRLGAEPLVPVERGRQK
jgi:hypothetical protein